RHVEIHHDGVGAGLERLAHGLLAVSGGADDLDAGLEPEGQPECLGKQLVIVGDQNANGRHRTLLLLCVDIHEEARKLAKPARTLRRSLFRVTGGSSVRVCGDCGGELESAYRFCPWCAAPQRRKLVEFFRAHPRDSGKALRVSRYLTEDPHVRFSVWSPDGVAEAAVSLEEPEADRLAAFLAAPPPVPRTAVERLLARLR